MELKDKRLEYCMSCPECHEFVVSDRSGVICGDCNIVMPVVCVRYADGTPRDEIRRLSRVMEQRLRDNDYKGGWASCKDAYLLAKMLEEVAELIAALCAYRPRGALPGFIAMLRVLAESIGRLPPIEFERLPLDLVQGEASDVANYAVMIVDNGRKREGSGG